MMMTAVSGGCCAAAAIFRHYRVVVTVAAIAAAAAAVILVRGSRKAATAAALLNSFIETHFQILVCQTEKREILIPSLFSIIHTFHSQMVFLFVTDGFLRNTSIIN